MNIVWHGQSFFEIWTKDQQNGELKIAIDPFDKSLGLRVPKVTAQILLITHSHPDHANKKAVLGEPFLIEGPGEYEVKGVFVKGILSFHDNSQGKEMGTNIIYKFETEGMKICHLGNLGQKELTAEQVEEIGQVDILMISIAGPFTDAKTCSAIVSQIEPKLVIPMHYKIPKLKVNIEGVDKFLKVMGQDSIEPQKKLKVKLSDLSTEETKIVVLEPRL